MVVVLARVFHEQMWWQETSIFSVTLTTRTNSIRPPRVGAYWRENKLCMLRSISNCSVHLWCYYRHDHPVWNLWLHHWQEGWVDTCFSPTDLLNTSFLQGSSVSWLNLDISPRVSFGCTFWGWDWSNSWGSLFWSPEEMPAGARNNGICQALDSFFLNVLRLSMPGVQQQLEGVLSHFSPQECMVDGMTLELWCSMSGGGDDSGQNHMGSCL